MKTQEIRSQTGLTLNEGSRLVEGYAVVFDQPSDGLGWVEVIHRGAITEETIRASDVFCKFNHQDDKILARSKFGEGSLSLTVDDYGLKYSFQAPKTVLGDELLEYLGRGEITASSFAFTVSTAEGSEQWKKSGGIVYRDIYKVDFLYDVSPVFLPAYEATSCLKRFAEVREQAEEDEVPLVSLFGQPNPDPQEDTETKEDDAETMETPVVEEEQPDEASEPFITEQTEEDTEPTEEPEQTTEAEEDTEQPKAEETKLTTKTTMEKRFSLISAINDVANNKRLDDISTAVINAGVNEMRKAGVNYGGQIQLPTSELRSSVTVTAEGEDVVATDLYDILEPLRAKNVLLNAGAKFITGLVGNVRVPVMGASNVTWEGENGAAKDGAPTFSSVELSPKRLTAYIDISKQFLAQDSAGAEAMIRQDLVNAINTKLEQTILGSGAGSATTPKGMSNNIVPTTIADFAGITALEAKVEAANVLGECKYIVSPTLKGKLRNMAKSAKTTQLVMEGGEIDGTPVLTTSNASSIIYGDWSNLAVGQWGSVDITVDPYSRAANGEVRLVVNAYFDAKVLRPEAFAFGTIA